MATFSQGRTEPGGLRADGGRLVIAQNQKERQQCAGVPPMGGDTNILFPRTHLYIGAGRRTSLRLKSESNC